MKHTNSALNTHMFLLYIKAACRFVYKNIFKNIFVRLVPRKLKLLKLKFVIGFIIFVFIYLLFISDINFLKIYTTPTPFLITLNKPEVEKLKKNVTKNTYNLKIPSEAEFRRSLIEKKLEKISKLSDRWDIKKLLNSASPMKPTTRVQIFYYIYFENIDVNGKWKLWNQTAMSNIISKNEIVKSGEKVRKPPLNIGSSYYPLLGCYNSRDSLIMRTHLKQIYDAGIGVLIALWNPQDKVFSTLLDLAEKNQLKVAFHLQILKDQSIETIRSTIETIILRYTAHPAFYKIKKNGKYLPVYYIFESYLITPDVWREILANDGILSIRGTRYDGVFIGLLCDLNHKFDIKKSNFDGFYTYFPSNGHTFGSTWKNWKLLQNFARIHQLLFFPSVSPGYVDTHGNTALTRHRSRGRYYQVAWQSAIAASTVGLTITSFNDWQHGSQVEPAMPKHTAHFTYLDYEPEGPMFYLNLTRYMVKQFVSHGNYLEKDIEI